MKLFVLDASVVLNFLLVENSGTVRKLTEILRSARDKKTKICSTFLLPLEVGNGLRYSLKKELLTRELIEKFSYLPIEYHSFQKIHYPEILKLTYKLNTSYYDTSYHFLAKLLGGVFLTCDQAYFKKAKRIKRIELL